MSRAGTRMALWIALAVPSAGRAQSVEVESMLRRGVVLRLRHDDTSARALFAEALTRCGCAEAEGQLALAEQALGRWAEAEAHLAEALRGQSDPWVVRNRRELSRSLDAIAAHLGTVDVRCPTVGARVFADERPAGTVAAPGELLHVRAEPGVTVIRVRAEGHVEVTREVTVTAGRVTAVDVVLTAVPLPVTPSIRLVAPVAPVAPATAPVAMPPHLREVAPSGHPRSGPLPAVYWLAGAAGVALALGLAAQVGQQVYVGQYNDDARCLVAGQTRDATCGSIGRAADGAEAIAVAGYIVAGGMALAAAVTGLVAGRTGQGDRSVMACWVAGEFGCRVRF